MMDLLETADSQQKHRKRKERLHIAAMAMQGMLSFGGTLNNSQNKSPGVLIPLALNFADALIKEIDSE